MGTTQIAAAIDKLVALFDAATTVDVYDGPKVAFPVGEWIVVGGDGPVNEEEDAGRTSQEWKGLGALIRDESIDIICACGSSTGNAETTMKPRRDAALAILSACEAALRANPGLTGFTTGGAAAIGDIALRYPTNTQGLAAVYVFTVNIPVRT